MQNSQTNITMRLHGERFVVNVFWLSASSPSLPPSTGVVVVPPHQRLKLFVFFSPSSDHIQRRHLRSPWEFTKCAPLMAWFIILSTKELHACFREISAFLRCSQTHLFDGGHLDSLVVVQRCVGCVHVVAETSHGHLVTVMQCHCYSNCSQSWNVLWQKQRRMRSEHHSTHTLYYCKLIQGLIRTKNMQDCNIFRRFWSWLWFLTLPLHVSTSLPPLFLCLCSAPLLLTDFEHLVINYYL